MKGLVRQVEIASHVKEYVARVVMATHPTVQTAPATTRKYVRYGASPRGAQAIVLGAKVRALLAGRANVGKSSLLNGLAGTNRAITSALAGTTRDVLSASTTLPCGAKINLLDVAGFAPAENSLAMAADQAARSAVARADMILFVIDAQTGWEEPDRTLLAHVQAVNPTAPILQLENKTDLAEATEGRSAILTSAETGEEEDI